MKQKLYFEDNSGDKDFFTIVPNYILNHSTAIDQALYLQLKRLAGEKKDYCYPSFGYLMKQLKTGKKALKKSFDYLIKHGWIENLGKRQVMTAGGYQWVNAYRIKNIWNLNANYYKNKGGSERTPLAKKGGLKEPKGGLKEPKGGLIVSCKEELKEELKKNCSSFKKPKKKPHFRGEEMRWSRNKWWVIPNSGGNWLEFTGDKSKIEWK